MNQFLHSVLLVSASTETTDRIFELCEQCEQANIRILIARHAPEALSLLEHTNFSLALLDLADLEITFMDQVSAHLNPKPVVALLDDRSEAVTAEALLAVLRAGADDVFLQSELQGPYAQSFVDAMKRQLRRALHIEEARLLRESLERSLDELRADHHAAQQVQQNLLPPREQLINQLRFEYTLTPSLLLSGDFVDAIELNEHQVMFYLADVSGHGASSALVTVLLKNMTYRLLRNYKRHSSFDILSPLSTLSRINQEVLLTGLGKHLTMFVGLIDTQANTLIYAVGGHHPMPVFSTDTQSQFLEGRGMPVGLFETPVFEERQVDLPERFRLTLFSDGILEVMGQASLAEKEARLLASLNQGFLSSSALITQLTQKQGVYPDDVAIMTVSRA
ncbi:PP2C family protein-serine/threonine phosphatase [Nitrincola tapanii]|uniref:Fused response regulator/phosphatase n=1 Tax=Nitrincola tapanii TaxID=1708751 RepID=A0A5A9W3G0_9GAMM|nr:SpoIIE family protein phosphatase [Nitrincola tapanii]KAA0875276.1 fused response regulator/phosphatase [Nitrincola tapanii]